MINRMQKQQEHIPQEFIARVRAKEVFLAGSFNDWNPKALPMRRRTKGEWRATLRLEPGRYEYKFVVDGEWRCAPDCDRPYGGCPNCVQNKFGTMNRVLHVW